VSLSKRVGYETLNEFGTEVAYQVYMCTCCLFLVLSLPWVSCWNL